MASRAPFVVIKCVCGVGAIINDSSSGSGVGGCAWPSSSLRDRDGHSVTAVIVKDILE